MIKKVIDIISRTEHQLVQLLLDEAGGAVVPVASEPVESALEGPQIPENALRQDDVDDLLASMGF